MLRGSFDNFHNCAAAQVLRGLPQDWGCEGQLGIFASVL